ncbi:MAG: hypothetical protein II685_04430 [Clostridia bacterium]|nr:hypothetical protein [Clostridia bacterium]
MKNLFIKITALAVCAAVTLSLSACSRDNTDKTDAAESRLETADTASQSSAPVFNDVGQHKDYDKETAECYQSYSVMITTQDGKNRGFDPFVYQEEFCEFYGNEINALKDRLGVKYNVYSMIIPSSCELYCPSNKRSEVGSQQEAVKYVRDMLVNVDEVNVFDTLSNHNAENIYYRTDSRWSSLAAYYAGRVFANAAGVDYADISEYSEKTPSSEYLGNFMDRLDPKGYEMLEKNPDTFVYYEPKAKFDTHYYDEEFEYLTDGKFFEVNKDFLYDSYFKGGYYCLKLSTQVKNGRKLIIVKDDYGTALAPFFTSSFEEIYVVDIDYLNANLVEMIEEFKITDVLYALSADTLISTNVYKLETLRTQASHGTLEDNAPEVVSEESADGKKKSSDSDIDLDSDTESEAQFVYDVGVNNAVGIMVDSEVVSIDEYYSSLESSAEEDYIDDYDEEDDYTQDDYEYYD